MCRQAVELVTDYLEDALSPRERARLETHLDECPHCPEYFDQMRATIVALGRIEADALAPDVRDDLVTLYRRYQRG